MSPDTSRFISVHIDKTAGTSLRSFYEHHAQFTKIFQAKNSCDYEYYRRAVELNS